MNTNLNAVLDTMLSASGLSEDFKQGIKVTRALSEAMPTQATVPPKPEEIKRRILIHAMDRNKGACQHIQLIRILRQHVSSLTLQEGKYITESICGQIWENGKLSPPFTKPCMAYQFFVNETYVPNILDLAVEIRSYGFICEVL
jgi:hypothetical protein